MKLPKESTKHGIRIIQKLSHDVTAWMELSYQSVGLRKPWFD